MVFSSILFLFRFLPIAFLIYYITPKKLKNLSLAGSTAYQITFKGITDFLGDAIDAACSFETASTDPVVSIECDDSDSVYPAGAKVNFKITSANLEGNPVVIYNNDEIVTTLLPDSEEFSVVLGISKEDVPDDIRERIDN